MQVLKWKIKRLITIIFISIFVFLWMRPREFTHKDEVRIFKMNPSEVWEYVADFSNMIKLNPTIIDFSVISETGNYEHWQYTTKYTEVLSHWPYLKNDATATFSVHGQWRKHQYFINSTHTTCFIAGMYCLNSNSEFKFTLINNINVGATPDTHCEEIVNYECPLSFYYFCRREVVFQREAIMKNLKLQFNNV